MTDIEKIFGEFMSEVSEEKEKEYRESMENDRQKLLHCFHQWMRSNTSSNSHGTRVRYRKTLYEILAEDGNLYRDMSDLSSKQRSVVNKLNEFIEDCGGEIIETS